METSNKPRLEYYICPHCKQEIRVTLDDDIPQFYCDFCEIELEDPEKYYE